MQLEQARELVALADATGLTLATAPANGLSDAHRLVSDALAGRDRNAAAGLCRHGGRSGLPGQLDDLAVPLRRAMAWPARVRDRLHAGTCGLRIVLARLPLRCGRSPDRVLGVTFPDKGPGTRHHHGPDFSVGCLTFRSGPVARLSCGLAAPKNRSLHILGDKGTIWYATSGTTDPRFISKNGQTAQASPSWRTASRRG